MFKDYNSIVLELNVDIARKVGCLDFCDVEELENSLDMDTFSADIIKHNLGDLDLDGHCYFNYLEILLASIVGLKDDGLNDIERKIGDFFTALSDLYRFFSQLDEKFAFCEQKEFVALHSYVDQIITIITQTFKEKGFILLPRCYYKLGKNNPLNYYSPNGSYVAEVFQTFFSTMKVNKMKENFSFDILHQMENRYSYITRRDFEEKLLESPITSLCDPANAPFYFGDYLDEEDRNVLLCHHVSTFTEIIDSIGKRDLVSFFDVDNLKNILSFLGLPYEKYL